MVGKGVLFLLIAFLLLHGLAALARSVAPDGTSTFLKIDREHVDDVLADALEVEAVVVGSSHGDDIDVNSIGYKGYQLSRAWGDLFEMQYYLEYLVPRLSDLQVVYIPVSYFTFYWDNAAAEKLVVRRQNMYSVIPAWGPANFSDSKNFVIGRGTELVPVSTVLREDNWEGVFYGLLHRQPSVVESVAEDPCRYLQPAALEGQAKLRAEEQIEFAEEIQKAHERVQSNAYETAVEIIRFLQQRGIRVVFFTPPYSAAYTEYYQAHDAAALSLLQDNMQRLQNEWGVEYYDFATHEEFAMNNQLFKDADHLNRCGAVLFSEALTQAMSSGMVQKQPEN